MLEGLEAVRMRPGMFLGSTGPRGQLHAVETVIQEAIHEHWLGNATHIVVAGSLGPRFVVAHDGEGPHPFDGTPAWRSWACVLTHWRHWSEVAVGSTPAFTGGLHGVGPVVTNALCEAFELEVQRDGRCFVERFRRGASLGPPADVGPSHQRRVTTRFELDLTVFEGGFPDADLTQRIAELAALNPGPTVLHDGVDRSLPRGLVALAERSAVHPVVRTRRVSVGLDGVGVQMALLDVEGPSGAIRVWVNGIPIESGSPFEAVCRRIGDAEETGAVVFVGLRVPEPRFTGAIRADLDNPEVIDVLDRIFDALDRIPASLDALVDGSAVRTAVLVDWAREHGRSEVVDVFGRTPSSRS